MSALRTQVYLTAAQRRRLDELRTSQDKTLAELVREAIDAYLDQAPSLEAALERTRGALPDLEVPARGEWVQRERRSGSG